MKIFEVSETPFLQICGTPQYIGLQVIKRQRDFSTGDKSISIGIKHEHLVPENFTAAKQRGGRDLMYMAIILSLSSSHIKLFHNVVCV